MTTRPAWLPDLAIGSVVAVFGLWDVLTLKYERSGTLLVIVLFFAVAAGLHRIAPGFALGLVWLGCWIQLLSNSDIVYAQLAVVLVAFGCARWGQAATLWLSGLSMPVGALLAATFVMNNGTHLGDIFVNDVFSASRATGIDLTRGVVAGLGFLILALPWLVGLVFRVRAQARRSRQHEIEAVASKEQAEEIATLRAEQTRLAHDVHDVVGHSLAVILAQAESAQFLPDDDPGRLKATMANIADSARQSLRDVRHVLGSGDAPMALDGGLDKLIDGVRAAGNDLRSTVVGTPRPLPPEIDAVAYRTLQEMLTNAIKHGVRGDPVTVIRHWGEELTVTVQNRVPGGSATPPGDGPEAGGLGLAGMRMRVESVGGRVDSQRQGDAFTVTAWLPIRHGMMTG